MELEHIFNKYGLSPEQHSAFGERFRFRQLNANETVFLEGDPSETFYFVRSGELVVSRFSMDRQEKVLNVLGPGEFFGEIGLLNNVNRTATVKALTAVQLYELDKTSFEELLQGDQAFAAFLERVHLQRLLHDIPQFRNLDDEALSRIREQLQERQGRAGETLVSAGQRVNALHLFVQGKARRVETSPQGNDIILGRLYPGAHFGGDGLLERTRHESSVVLEDDSKLYVLDSSRFRRLIRKYPAIAFNVPGIGLADTLLPFLHNKLAYLSIPFLAMNRPRMINRLMILVTLLISLAAIIPSLWPGHFPALNALHVDTDPENMLALDQPARQFHKQMKQRMNLYDIMVLGVVNDAHPDGVFNLQSMARIHEITEFAKTLRWPDDSEPGLFTGVRAVDIMSPSTVDIVEQAGPGAVNFSWLMPRPPTSEDQVAGIRAALQRYPMMNGTLVSDDGKALSIYLPLTSKDISFRVYEALKQHIAELPGDEQYYITGLPVAEDAFGVEMFFQMAISAPLAMLVIFVLLYLFFRNLVLIVAPMIVALVSVLCTMGLLIISGNTVHIMSSMIPIFIMPIAVLDSVHILSEFFDYYPRLRDRRLTMEHVMRELFTPMLYTSTTTAIGFASLSLVPIPPVQVFGVFVALGVLLAWLLSISFIPAYIMLIPKHKLDKLAAGNALAPQDSAMNSLLKGLSTVTRKYALSILVVTFMLVTLCLYGISRIQVNDNPVRWFAAEHPIRVADRVLNKHFSGTYMAFLALESVPGKDDTSNAMEGLVLGVRQLAVEDPESTPLADEFVSNARTIAGQVADSRDYFYQLEAGIEQKLDEAAEDDLLFWEDVQALLDEHRLARQPMKDPQVLAYIEKLQQNLSATGIVGKSVSLADISKTINRELRSGRKEDYSLPSSRQGVAETLLTYQSGHRPDDLWRFVTPDYRTASIWLLLNSGDNQDMSRVIDSVESFMAADPPPVALQPGWFGLTYINVIWQEKMVAGMLLSIAGSFLTVLLLLTLLLRSALWGLMAMVPLSSAMLIIYGVLGLLGKPYDMPVAVLSALAIGLAVDFTIHFLVRLRHFMSQTGSWQAALEQMFAEPAKAIVRNILVVAVGFLPLLAAPLIPYNTVGNLISIILLSSGITTLLILSAMLRTWNRRLFPQNSGRRTTNLHCVDLLFVGTVAIALLVLAGKSFMAWELSNLGWYLIPAVLVVGVVISKCRGRVIDEAPAPPCSTGGHPLKTG